MPLEAYYAFWSKCINKDKSRMYFTPEEPMKHQLFIEKGQKTREKVVEPITKNLPHIKC